MDPKRLPGSAPWITKEGFIDPALFPIDTTGSHCDISGKRLGFASHLDFPLPKSQADECLTAFMPVLTGVFPTT
jgi:hypothetical protein